MLQLHSARLTVLMQTVLGLSVTLFASAQAPPTTAPARPVLKAPAKEQHAERKAVADFKHIPAVVVKAVRLRHGKPGHGDGPPMLRLATHQPAK